MKQEFFIYSDQIKTNAVNAVRQVTPKDKTPMVVTIKPETRRDRQNRLMWVLLGKLSKYIKWPVKNAHGVIEGVYLCDYEWKDIMSASLQGEGRLAQDPNSNQMVLLGCSTRRETVTWMTDMIELIYAFAAQQGINLDD